MISRGNKHKYECVDLNEYNEACGQIFFVEFRARLSCVKSISNINKLWLMKFYYIYDNIQ